jgi:integrase
MIPVAEVSAAEVAALATVCGDQGDVVLILAYTGLRFGELTGLNTEDVDLDARASASAAQ